MKRLVSLLLCILVMIVIAAPLTVSADEDENSTSYEITAHFNSQAGERPTRIMNTYEDDRFVILSESWYNMTDNCYMIEGEGTPENTIFEEGKRYRYKILVKFLDGNIKPVEIKDMKWDGYGTADTQDEDIMEFEMQYVVGVETVTLPKNLYLLDPVVGDAPAEKNYITVDDNENYKIDEQYWKDENGHILTAEDCFEDNIIYTYYLKLVPKDGYKFDSAFSYLKGVNWYYEYPNNYHYEGSKSNFECVITGDWLSRNTVIKGLNNKVGQSPSWTCDYDKNEFNSVKIEWYNKTDGCSMDEKSTYVSKSVFEKNKVYEFSVVLEPSTMLASHEKISVEGFDWVNGRVGTSYTGRHNIYFVGLFSTAEKNEATETSTYLGETSTATVNTKEIKEHVTELADTEMITKGEQTPPMDETEMDVTSAAYIILTVVAFVILAISAYALIMSSRSEK